MSAEKVFRGRFVVENEIAARASCKVYLGKDRELGGKEVAIKIFNDKSGPDTLKLYEEEIAAFRKTTHQTLIPIVDGGSEGDELFMVLEYVPGLNLRDKLKEAKGPLEIEQSVNMIAKLCEGVHEIHIETFQGKPLFHGHIDSRAILFKGEEPRLAGYHPRAIDILQKQMTSVARVAADAAYISPEQLSGSEEVDGRSDIYALGIILYEMISGERPFVAANPLQAAMLRMTVAPQAPSKKNPAISPLLDAAIMKALAKDPKERFQTALEFKEALQGNKKPSKNPFFTEGERMSTETLATSFSTSDIQAILKGEAPKAAPNPVPQSPVAAPALGGETSQTMMGVSTESILKAGLIYLTSSKRGDRVGLDKQQMLIGSDSSCDIVISGKEASPRHLLLVQKEGGTFACAISTKGAEVSGVPLKAEEEKKLQKGDTLKVGADEFRFLLPGEVFTLKEDGITHQAGNVKGRGGKILLIATLMVGVIALGGIYLYKQQIDQAKYAQKSKQVEQSKKRDVLIKKLIQEGDDLLKKGALTEPVGENALEKFQAVLTLDPENSYSKRRLEELTDRKRQLSLDEDRRRQLQGKLTELINQGDYYVSQNQLVSPPGKNAKESYGEVLKLDATNPTAKAKIAEIDKMLGDVLGRVKGSLEQAREYVRKGQFIDPAGENAVELIKEIQKIDPENKEAKDLTLEMAARSLLNGDAAKEKKAVKDVRRNYLIAQSLGVDPACIEQKMKGLDLIAKSSGKVVMANEKVDCPQSAAGFLDSGELGKRIAKLKLEMELQGH